MLGTGRKVQGWGGGGGMKTGSGSYNYKLLKRGGGVPLQNSLWKLACCYSNIYF